MRKALIVIPILLPIAAFAQAPQPVTLSAEEWQMTMRDLMNRDPIMAMLNQKQLAAQQAASAQANAQLPQGKGPGGEPSQAK